MIPPTDRPRRPGRPRLLTDADLVCVAVDQVLLRRDDERRWLRLMDGTPVRCGASRTTVNRSRMGEIAVCRRDVSHHALHRGAKLITTAEGAIRALGLANPKELDEHKQALHPLGVRPPATGPTPIVCDKGFAGAQIERAAAHLGVCDGSGGGVGGSGGWPARGCLNVSLGGPRGEVLLKDRSRPHPPGAWPVRVVCFKVWP